MARLALCLAAAICGLASCPARVLAQTAEVTQEIFNRQGLPLLIANPTPDGGKGKIVAWRKCPPRAGCEPVPVEGDDDRSIEPGDVPVGTIFEADALSSGALTTARSLAWRGRVTANAPPSLAGTLRVGRLLRPEGGTWTGGWDADYSRLGLEACREPDGRRCETLSAEGEDPPGCTDGRAVLGRRYEGWWVRAVESRFARDTAFGGVGHLRIRDVPPPKPGRTVARTPLLGPVRPNAGNFRECARPSASILARPRILDGRLTFARVLCVSSCDVVLIVRDARRRVRLRTEPSPFGFVGLPRRTRLAGRRAVVRVIVNGRLEARRTAQLPRR